MVERSARVSHALGNRRFHQWVFEVDGRIVQRMSRIDAPVAVPTQGVPLKDGEFYVHEECVSCFGGGCSICHWSGEVQLVRKLSNHKFGAMT
jgi:hypothetical protein